jgi:hypothetical protein
MLSLFSFMLFLKDWCTPQQENSNNRRFLVRLVAKTLKQTHCIDEKIPKLSRNTNNK